MEDSIVAVFHLLAQGVMYIFQYLLTILSFVANPEAATTPFCKSDPTSPQWPTAQDWQALNVSVSGALQAPIALATVCHPGQASYNNASCAAVLTNWTSTNWVASNGWGADYNDETCLPDARAPCSTAGYPAYIVEANTANDVAAGVKFARDYHVRLIIKGTGHDFPGRSSGPGSLSIWTHKLQGMNVTVGDPRAIRYNGTAAVKIGAGMRFGEIYAEAAKQNITIVGGADPGVGICGWISGGGHSPVSSRFGLGADQVLEIEVVTADGQIRTVNENNDADLFWALRGGGGSTFGVMTSVTVKAYNVLPATIYIFAYNTTIDSDTYWQMTAAFHTYLPRLSSAGGMGYYYVVPQGISPTEKRGNILGQWIFPAMSPVQVRSIMLLLEEKLTNNSLTTDKINISSSTIPVPDFMTFWSTYNQPQAAGSSGRLGSYLYDADALTTNLSLLTTTLRTATTSSFPPILIGHLIAGPGVHNANIPGGSNAVLPAWRHAYAHLVIPSSWTPLNLIQKNNQTRTLRSQIIPRLKSLAPHSGAYINEADPTNPDWQHDYFGTNYPRLLHIKQTYDPDGVFWCKPCVGHEEWEVVDGPTGEDPENWGIAQVAGRICRTASSIRNKV